jgi:hypothetical protein
MLKEPVNLKIITTTEVLTDPPLIIIHPIGPLLYEPLITTTGVLPIEVKKGILCETCPRVTELQKP